MTAQIAPSQGEPVRENKRRDVMLWLIGVIFAAYLLTNIVMLTVALRSPPALVSQSYYEDSRTFEAEQNAQRASDAAGWQITAHAASASELTVQLKDRTGHPASGFAGVASAYRPSDPALDQPMTWTEDAAHPGQYLVRFATPRPGQWHIHLMLRRGGERLDHEFRIDTP